jgi:transcriptional regulator with XRE-family HTH domain
MSDSPALIDGRKLLAKRKEAKLTQVGLAERAGLHYAYISMLERGVRGGGPETLGALAGAFRCPVTELMPDALLQAA